MAAKKKTTKINKFDLVKLNKFVLAKINLKPAAGYLLIEPVGKETKTDSGIYLPESVEEKPQKGRVLSVGPDEVTEQGAVRKPPAKKGDIVIYKKWGGNEVKIDGVEYLFTKFEDILAVEG